MESTFLAFVGISVLVILTPGPDTAVTIRNTLLGGRSGGVFTALGIALGQTIWALATSIGVVALLVASEPLFLAVKYAGAGYLVFLGAQALLEAFRSTDSSIENPIAKLPERRLKPLSAFSQGVISDLGNPKMAVFFASLLPQFTPPGEATFSALLFLGLTFALMTLTWLAAYAIVLAKAGDVLRRPRLRRSVEGITGAFLIALGLRIATEQR
jgi:threonine/homoserine/homoserine lactone efflux protein